MFSLPFVTVATHCLMSKAFSTRMLQTFANTRPYSQPLSPLEAKWDRYVLPQNFVEGLASLRPFVEQRGDTIEHWVHVLGGKLYVTNNLVIDYEIGATDLPNVGFAADTIRVLEAFETPPSEVVYEPDTRHFQWPDGQELGVHCAYTVMNARPTYPSSESHEQVANDTFDRFLRFNDRIVLTEKNARKFCGRMVGHDPQKHIWMAKPLSPATCDPTGLPQWKRFRHSAQTQTVLCTSTDKPSLR